MDGKIDNNSYCAREMTIIEEIKALSIEEKIKKRLLDKLEDEDSRNYELEDEVYRCHREIEKLEKAVLFLSKEIAEYKED